MATRYAVRCTCATYGLWCPACEDAIERHANARETDTDPDHSGGMANRAADAYERRLDAAWGY